MASRLITNTAEELIPRNRLRKSMIVQNEDPALNCYIKRERTEPATVSATDHDHRLAPGGLLALNFGTDGIEAIQDRWTIISDAGNPRISLFETEDIVR